MQEEQGRSFAGNMSKMAKSSISEPQPLVLFCTKDEGKSQQIRMLCGQFGYRTRLLNESDADKFVGKLAGITGKYPAAGKNGKVSASAASEENNGSAGNNGMSGKAPAGYFQPEIMIFSGISSEGLDMFLGAWRMAGIAPVALKAVLTPYNYTWTVYQLTQELIREHTAMVMERRK